MRMEQTNWKRDREFPPPGDAMADPVYGLTRFRIDVRGRDNDNKAAGGCASASELTTPTLRTESMPPCGVV
jgi:hypothetical protein